MSTETTDGALQVGRALDAAVAERVMGLVPCTAEFHRDGRLPGPCHALPESPDQGGETRPYSTDIEAAWEVVEAMKARGYGFLLADSDGEPALWQAVFDGVSASGAREVTEWAASAPVAICRAALAAEPQP